MLHGGPPLSAANGRFPNGGSAPKLPPKCSVGSSHPLSGRRFRHWQGTEPAACRAQRFAIIRNGRPLAWPPELIAAARSRADEETPRSGSLLLGHLLPHASTTGDRAGIQFRMPRPCTARHARSRTCATRAELPLLAKHRTDRCNPHVRCWRSCSFAGRCPPCRRCGDCVNAAAW